MGLLAASPSPSLPPSSRSHSATRVRGEKGDGRRGHRALKFTTAALRTATNPSNTSGSARASYEAQEAVHTALEAQQLYQLQGGRSAVPLLLPATHNLPFGMALELISTQHADDTAFSPVRSSGNAYQLCFVMCGGGLVGGSQALSAGDSVLSFSGDPRGSNNISAVDGGGRVDDWDLVLLHVVFPSDILETDVASLEAGPAVEGTARYWLSGSPRGATGAKLAADILQGAKKAAQRGLAAAAGGVGKEPKAALVSGSSLKQPFFHHQLNRHFQRHHAAIAALEEHAKRLLHNFHPWNRTRLRRLMEVDTFQLPNQTNLLALVFDPLGESPQPFTFGIEVFQSGHKTPPHKHNSAYEVFFILSGSGVAFCDKQRFNVRAGDTLVFPPKSVHGIDNSDDSKMYLLELMLPNDAFAEFVRQGQISGLDDDDLCVLIGHGCGAVPVRPPSQ